MQTQPHTDQMNLDAGLGVRIRGLSAHGHKETIPVGFSNTH